MFDSSSNSLSSNFNKESDITKERKFKNEITFGDLSANDYENKKSNSYLE